MFQRLYGWAMAKAAHPHAFWWLVAFAFAEATFFPLPADILLIPMVLAVRARAWRLAAACTVASVAGGCFGWLIGTFAFEELGRPLLELYGAMDKDGRSSGRSTTNTANSSSPSARSRRCPTRW